MSEVNLNALSQPIPAKHIRKREAGKDKQGNKVFVSFITARTVMNRLDEAVGRENWKTEYTPLSIGGKPGVMCTLFIRVEGEWIGKSDVGDPSNIDEVKGAFSDSLKRAAAQWGIARELYGDGNVYDEADDEPQPKVNLQQDSFQPPVEGPAANPAAEDWITLPGALQKMVAWAHETVWAAEGLPLKHAQNRVAKALGCSKYAAIILEYRGTKEDAAKAIREYKTDSEPTDETK